MKNNKNRIRSLFFLIHILFCQMNDDARMLGLNGSCTTLAKGFRSVGINPANLAVYQTTSWNIIDYSFGVKNNYFSIKNYNILSGSHLDDTTHENYYSKDKILEQFKGEGLRIFPNFHLRLPVLNISNNNYAFTSSISSNSEIGISNGVLEFILSGNPLNQNVNLDINESIDITQELSFSYGHSFNGFAAGITIKYLMGLFYMGIEPISNTTISTDYYGSHGNPQYIVRQEIGGQGIGLDLGIISNKSQNVYRIGASVINLLGTIHWNQNSFIQDNLGIEGLFSKMDYYLRPNELTYINMVVDSFVIDKAEDSLIYYEMYNVIPIETLTNPSDLAVELSDGTYLYPSGGTYKYIDVLNNIDTSYTVSNNYLEYPIKSNSLHYTRKPIYLRIGMSKQWIDQATIAFDLVTGFLNQSSSSTNWRFSLGIEITKFKNQYLRMGVAAGGIDGKSVSFGYGIDLGPLYIDTGLLLNGGGSIYTAKGFDFSTGLIWEIR